MATCHDCKKLFPTVNSVVHHMRMFCKKSSKSEVYSCGEAGCFRNFSSTNSLRKHLSHFHKVPTSEGDLSKDVVSSPMKVVLPSLVDDNTVPKSPNTSFSSSFSEKFAQTVSSFYINPSVPRNQVQNFTAKLIDFVEYLTMEVRQKLMPCFEDYLPPELEQLFRSYSSALSSFDSEYKRLKVFESIGVYVPPEQHCVGYRQEVKGRPKTITSSSNSIQIISLRKVFQNFFSLPNILRETVENMNRGDTGETLCNILQGSAWKNMKALFLETEGVIHIPIVLYYDDFEVNNPLGSHASIHKLGALYVSIPVLPKKYASLLNCIFMFSLFHASDRREFGNKVIFEKPIEHLNGLSSEGVSISTEYFSGTLKFHVVCFTGDNLGLNGVLGFVESFSANHCCRICSTSKEQMTVLDREDLSLMRNIENYERDLLINDISKTGIKERCVWLKLRGFDLFHHVAVDYLHDFLEGCCRYVMHYVITSLICSNNFGLGFLQTRIRSFDYGPDSSSSPMNALQGEGSSIKIKSSASEMANLVRYFTVIIGEHVLEDNETWSLYLMLREILDNLLRHRFYEDNVIYLSSLIEGFINKYSDVTKDNIKPKFHFLTHYPQMIMKFGNLGQICTYRFEAKHRTSKLYANSVSTRINICKSIAIRNQLVQQNIFLKNTGFETFTTGKKKALSEAEKVEVQKHFRMDISSLFSVKWFKLDGIRIEEMSILILELCPVTSNPIFVKTVDIWVDSITNKVYFSGLEYETICFNDHFSSYMVKNTSIRKHFRLCDLHSMIPQTISLLSDGTCFITLRIALD